jgi:hypothetical protein
MTSTLLYSRSFASLLRNLFHDDAMIEEGRGRKEVKGYLSYKVGHSPSYSLFHSNTRLNHHHHHTHTHTMSATKQSVLFVLTSADKL